MDSGLAMGVLSLTLSIIAIAISAYAAIRQSRLMHHGNLLPVITDLFVEFRDPRFREHLDYLQISLWDEVPPTGSGMSDMPLEVRVHVMKVASFFNTVGLLVAQGVVEDIVPASALGGSILRAWSRLSPYVRTERLRRNDPNYVMYFEDLARRALDFPPSRLRRALKLRSMPGQWHFEGWEGQSPEITAALFTMSGKKPQPDVM